VFLTYEGIYVNLLYIYKLYKKYFYFFFFFFFFFALFYLFLFFPLTCIFLLLGFISYFFQITSRFRKDHIERKPPILITITAGLHLFAVLVFLLFLKENFSRIKFSSAKLKIEKIHQLRSIKLKSTYKNYLLY
jgi:hypothetical protein